jgi:hypothetical protein
VVVVGEVVCFKVMGEMGRSWSNVRGKMGNSRSYTKGEVIDLADSISVTNTLSCTMVPKFFKLVGLY